MPRKEYKLNQNQVQFLKLLFKFRFANTELLARYKSVSQTAIKKTLANLTERKLIDRHYGSSYKFSGRGAEYYLTLEGMKLLRDMGLSQKAMRTMYNNTKATLEFRQQCLDIFAAYLRLRELYPETFSMFTRSELADFAYFPQPSPDLYLIRKTPLDDLINEYMLEINTDARFFVQKKRLDVYFEHADSGEWDDQGNGYPILLWICGDSRMEMKVQKYLENRLDDLEVRTTTLKALLNKHSQEKVIWSTEEKLVDL